MVPARALGPVWRFLPGEARADVDGSEVAAPRRVPFVMLPRPIGAALKAGELSRDQVAMWVALACAADPQTLEFVGTLDEIMRYCAWGSKSRDQARRALVGLRAGGWIDYPSTSGQRKPYRIKIADLRATSARPLQISGADMQRLTSAYAEVEKDAIPHGSTDQPLHDLRTRRGESSAEVELEVEDDVVTSTETPELEGLLAQVERSSSGDPLTPPQRVNARLAWGHRPDWVRSIAEESLKGGNPVALFVSLLAKGPSQVRAAARGTVSAEAVFSGLTHHIRNEGCHYDWSMVEEEIARREGLQRVRLTSDQQQDLFEQWLDEHIEPEVG